MGGVAQRSYYTCRGSEQFAESAKFKMIKILRVRQSSLSQLQENVEISGYLHSHGSVDVCSVCAVLHVSYDASRLPLRRTDRNSHRYKSRKLPM